MALVSGSIELGPTVLDNAQTKDIAVLFWTKISGYGDPWTTIYHRSDPSVGGIYIEAGHSGNPYRCVRPYTFTYPGPTYYPGTRAIVSDNNWHLVSVIWSPSYTYWGANGHMMIYRDTVWQSPSTLLPSSFPSSSSPTLHHISASQYVVIADVHAFAGPTVAGPGQYDSWFNRFSHRLFRGQTARNSAEVRDDPAFLYHIPCVDGEEPVYGHRYKRILGHRGSYITAGAAITDDSPSLVRQRGDYLRRTISLPSVIRPVLMAADMSANMHRLAGGIPL